MKQESVFENTLKAINKIDKAFSSIQGLSSAKSWNNLPEQEKSLIREPGFYVAKALMEDNSVFASEIADYIGILSDHGRF